MTGARTSEYRRHGRAASKKELQGSSSQHTTTRNPNPQSAVRSPQSAVRNLEHATLCPQQWDGSEGVYWGIANSEEGSAEVQRAARNVQ